jgi:carboxyl-terminal processing protease
MKRFLYLTFVLGLFFTACSKKHNPGPATALDKIKDSVFLYAKEDYLWYNALPSYETFNPRSFTGADDITALTNEVNALSQYAINPNSNPSRPYEYYSDNPGEAKYSFIDNGTVSSELNGVHGDFGFAPFYNTVTDLRVKYVYPGSPADLAHIKRGYQITSINGNTNLNYDGGNYGNGTNLKFVINAYSNSNTISMTLKRPDGTTLTVTNMNVSAYTVNPILKDTVFDQGSGHKVGYIVFNSFTSDANAHQPLLTAFNNFSAAGITDLVVDLRYNGGGYVSTAELIDNLIAPTSKQNTLMYTTYYNDILTNGREVLLKNQWRKDPTTGQDYNYGQFSYAVADNAVKFSQVPGANPLNITRVFFIVTGSTASASELTINNLRPVMDVQFIGEPSYGKPVGFFDIDINKYQLYIPEFYTQNSSGQGGYYDGFKPGTSDYPGKADYDDVTKDFGDPTEGLLAHALTYVTTGTYAVKTQSIQSLQAKYGTFSIEAQTAAAHEMDKHKFTGMIFNNMKKKK